VFEKSRSAVLFLTEKDVNFPVASRDVKESSLRAAFLFGLFKYHPEWVTAT